MKPDFFFRVTLVSLSSAYASAAELKPPKIGEQLSGLSPKEALAHFTAYEGFNIVQSAAEPDVCQPVAMTIDERGRVWVAEAYEYPIRAKGDVGRDRILIFEDKDGDGIFDDRKVFAEGLNLVSGLEVGFGGVWVGAAPYLMFIADADGDDKADGKPQVLLDGFGWQDSHETLNSFTWGPDGWLYGCHGVFTHSKVGKPGTPENERIPINAGVWRFHPLEKKFEVYAQGTSNPWGIDFNDRGQAFVTACVVPHLFHIIQGARYQRQAGQHFDPHTYDDIKTCADHLHYVGDQWASSRDGSSSDLGGGHAHCGLSIYLGDQFPAQFRDKLLFNNLHGHRINQEWTDRKGSGYVGKHQPDFLFSNDKQHMGISLRYGPDGGLFLSDWYDSQTCHNMNGEIWNRTNGRIYKITYGKSAAAQVDLRKQSDLELVELQLHKNDWFVRTARRLLMERAAAGTLDVAKTRAALAKMLAENPDETRRLRALWALSVIAPQDEAMLLTATKDQSEYVRGWAVQLLVERSEISGTVANRFAEMAASDKSQLVRLNLAGALQRIALAQRWEIAGNLLAHEADASDANLPLMIWYGVSDLVPSDLSRALKLAQSAKIAKVRQYLVRRISENDAGRAAVLSLVAGNAKDGGFAADALAGLAAAITSEGNLPASTEWAAASNVFESLESADSRRSFELVATIYGDKRMVDRFRKTLIDLKAKKEDRTAALANILRMRLPDSAELLMKLSADANDAQRGEWIRALALVKDDRIPDFLMGLFAKLDTREKEAAVQTLAATEAGARKLADGLTAGSIQRGDISAFAARQMRGYNQPAITAAVENYWGVISANQEAAKAETIAGYVKLLKPATLAKADRVKGRLTFQATCFACHQLFGEGMKIGPDLTGSNRADLKYLLENIIDPSALVGLDYQLHTITKADGQVIAGLLKNQTPASLTIGVLGGASVMVPAAEVKNHQVSTTSMMPEGLLANLTEEQVRDLVAYLQSTKQIALPVAGEVMIGDDQLKVAEVNRGVVQQQNMAAFKADSWSDNSQLWWTQGQPGDRVMIQFESAEAKICEVFAVFSKAHDYGKFRVKLNGEIGVESIDLFDASKVITTGDVSLGTHAVKAGLNQLVVELLGTNPAASPGAMFGIDHLKLVPVAK